MLAVTRDVLAAQAGDAVAFARLVDTHRTLVCSVALAATRNIAASEAVARDACVDAWRRIGTLRKPVQFRRWLLELVREHTPLIAPGQDPHVDETLKALPSFTRETIVLYCREWASLCHVAPLLDLKPGDVRERVELARELVAAHVLEDMADVLRATTPGPEFTRSVLDALPAATAASAVPVRTGAGRDAAALCLLVLMMWAAPRVQPAVAEVPEEKRVHTQFLPNVWTPMLAPARFSGASFEGVVSEASSGRSLTGARVTLREPGQVAEVAHVLTDEEGRFCLSGIAAGRYDLDAAAPGLGTIKRFGLLVDTDEIFTIDLALPDRPQGTQGSSTRLSGHAEVQGRVVTQDGTEARGFLLDVEPVGGEGGLVRSELAHDRFHLMDAPAGEIVMRVLTHDGQVGFARTLAGRQVAIGTCAPAAITGHVLTERPVQVRLVDAAMPATQTLDDGSFYLSDVPPGTFMLETAGQRRWIDVRCGSLLDVGELTR